MKLLWGSTGNGVVKSYFYLFVVGLDSSSACRLLNKILNVCVPANKLHLFNHCELYRCILSKLSNLYTRSIGNLPEQKRLILVYNIAPLKIFLHFDPLLPYEKDLLLIDIRSRLYLENHV